MVEEPAQSQDEEVSDCVRDVSSQPFSHTLPTLPRMRKGCILQLGVNWLGMAVTSPEEDHVMEGSSLGMKSQTCRGTNPSYHTDSQCDAGQESKGGNPASLEDSKNFAIPFSVLLIKRDKVF